MLMALATAYYNGGDYDNAVVYQTKIVKDARLMLKEGTDESGFITEAFVKTLEERLISYEKQRN